MYPSPALAGRTESLGKATLAPLLPQGDDIGLGHIDTGDLSLLMAGYATPKDHKDKAVRDAYSYEVRSRSHAVIENIAERLHWGGRNLHATIDGITVRLVSLDGAVLGVQAAAGALDEKPYHRKTTTSEGLPLYEFDLDTVLHHSPMSLKLAPLDTSGG